MFEEAIEVRDPISLDELIKKEFPFEVFYNLTLEAILSKGNNLFNFKRINHTIFRVPFGKSGKEEVIGKIFRSTRHRDILAKMNAEGYSAANIYEGGYFSMIFSKYQREIPIFTPADRKPDYCKGCVVAPCFTISASGEKNVKIEDISSVGEEIFLLGTKKDSSKK